MSGDQAVQVGDTSHPLRQAAPGQDPAFCVLQLDVVMGFRPVVSEKQHLQVTFHSTDFRREQRVRRPGRPNGLCSNGTTSHQPYDPLTNHQGHDLHIGLNDLVLAVLTQ